MEGETTRFTSLQVTKLLSSKMKILDNSLSYTLFKSRSPSSALAMKKVKNKKQKPTSNMFWHCQVNVICCKVMSYSYLYHFGSLQRHTLKDLPGHIN